MTNKELLYIEDAIGHEQFLMTCSDTTSTQLKDARLSNYIKSLQKQHCQTFEQFLNLL